MWQSYNILGTAKELKTTLTNKLSSN